MENQQIQFQLSSDEKYTPYVNEYTENGDENMKITTQGTPETNDDWRNDVSTSSSHKINRCN